MYNSSAVSWEIFGGSKDCVTGRAAGGVGAFGGSSVVCGGLLSSFRMTGATGAGFTGESSAEGYPSHMRPKFKHLRHSGLLSSHFTLLFLLQTVSPSLNLASIAPEKGRNHALSSERKCTRSAWSMEITHLHVRHPVLTLGLLALGFFGLSSSSIRVK
jgi:hypothetical protein